MNITEDYVSFEVAKLLKEKGFHEPCIATYNSTTKNFQVEEIYEDWTIHWKGYISVPTQQMAMKWLREEHEIDIIPIIRHNFKYAQESPFRDYACRVYDCDGNIVLSATKWYSRYENAVEAALKYCLEKIIK